MDILRNLHMKIVIIRNSVNTMTILVDLNSKIATIDVEIDSRSAWR